MRKSLSLVLGASAVIGVALAPAAASAATGGLAGHRHAKVAQHAGAAPAAGRGAAAAGGAVPATAAGGSANTAVTFTVNSGLLTFNAPTTANFGSGGPGSTISSLLGTITVTDNRALLNASWTATVSSTGFLTGTGTGAETIPAADAFYDPGAVNTTGTISISLNGVVLSGSPQAVVTASAGNGNNTANWNPRIVVTVPTSAVTGPYTGTITHSVS